MIAQQPIDPPAIYQLINQERAIAKLAPLVMNEKLNKAAMDKALDMVNKKYFAHSSPTGERGFDFIHYNKIGYNSAGENLAEGFKTSQKLTKKWLSSPSHRANILNGRYTETGIAVIPTIVKGKKTHYIVQLFTEPYGGTTPVGARR